MTKIQSKYNSYSSRTKKTTFAVVLAVAVYIGLAAGFKFWPFEKHVTITASSVENSLPSKNSKAAKSNSNDTSSKDADQAGNNNPKAPSQVAADTKDLTEPSGTFVNLYDANADTQMNSICNTTTGAKCQITFTRGSLSIALPAKTVDSNGAATWAWTPQQIGLTNGNWHVVAKATLGSQTKITDNGSLELVTHD